MNKVYGYVTERILEELEKGVIPWRRKWFTKKINYVSRKSYSGVNLLLLEKPGEYLTFNQVKKLNGKIKKGSKSSMVIYFKILEKNTGEKTPEGKDEIEKIPMLRYYKVFHIDDVEGIESKLENKEIKDINTAENYLKPYDENLKINIQTSERAYYSPSKDLIVVPKKEQYKNTEEFYSTSFHELIHSTGHKSRLDRIKKDASFGSEDYSKEELIAEIGSAMLASNANLDIEKTISNSASYIKSWMKVLKEDKTLIVSASSKANKAVEYIEERIN